MSEDLSPYNFRYEIFRFRARRRKNYEAYTVYMLNNFFKVVAEICKLQWKSYKGTGLVFMIHIIPDADFILFLLDLADCDGANVHQISDRRPAARHSKSRVHDHARLLAFLHRKIRRIPACFLHLFTRHKDYFRLSSREHICIAEPLKITLQFLLIKPAQTPFILIIRPLRKVVSLTRPPRQIKFRHGFIHEMPRRMDPCVKQTPIRVHTTYHAITRSKTSELKPPHVPYGTLHKAHLLHKKFPRRRLNHARIIRLSPALRIENRLIKQDDIALILAQNLHHPRRSFQ